MRRCFFFEALPPPSSCKPQIISTVVRWVRRFGATLRTAARFGKRNLDDCDNFEQRCNFVAVLTERRRYYVGDSNLVGVMTKRQSVSASPALTLEKCRSAESRPRSIGGGDTFVSLRPAALIGPTAETFAGYLFWRP